MAKKSSSPSRHPSTLSAPKTQKTPKSPKIGTGNGSGKGGDDESTVSHDKSLSSTGSAGSSDVVQRQTEVLGTGEKKGQSSSSKLSHIFHRAAPKIPTNSESSSKAINNEQDSDSDDDQPSGNHLRIGSEKSEDSQASKDSPLVDAEGYTIRKEAKRKESTSSSSSWDSDEDDRKVDTRKIKVK